MSVTFTFHTVAEKRPAAGEEIIWLKKTGGCLEGFDPRQVTVECYWEDDNGTTVCFDGEEVIEGHELKMSFDGWIVSDDDVWISVDDYWAALDKA